MPTYLIHGFRWARLSIRIHIILNDLEDAAAEWIIAPVSSLTLLNSFYTNFDFIPPSTVPTQLLPPGLQSENSSSAHRLETSGAGSVRLPDPEETREAAGAEKKLKKSSSRKVLRKGNVKNDNSPNYVNEKEKPKSSAEISTKTFLNSAHEPQPSVEHVAFNEWSVVKLLEQYDPDEVDIVSQPYAYVGDYVVKVKLGTSIQEEMARYETSVREQKTSSGPSEAAGTTTVNGSSNSASVANEAYPSSAWFTKLRDNLEKDAEIGWFVVVCGDEERAAPTDYDSGSEASDDNQEVKPERNPNRKGLSRFFSRKNLKDN